MAATWTLPFPKSAWALVYGSTKAVKGSRSKILSNDKRPLDDVIFSRDGLTVTLSDAKLVLLKTPAAANTGDSLNVETTEAQVVGACGADPGSPRQTGKVNAMILIYRRWKVAGLLWH